MINRKFSGKYFHGVKKQLLKEDIVIKNNKNAEFKYMFNPTGLLKKITLDNDFFKHDLVTIKNISDLLENKILINNKYIILSGQSMTFYFDGTKWEQFQLNQSSQMFLLEPIGFFPNPASVPRGTIIFFDMELYEEKIAENKKNKDTYFGFSSQLGWVQKNLKTGYFVNNGKKWRKVVYF